MTRKPNPRLGLPSPVVPDEFKHEDPNCRFCERVRACSTCNEDGLVQKADGLWYECPHLAPCTTCGSPLEFKWLGCVLGHHCPNDCEELALEKQLQAGIEQARAGNVTPMDFSEYLDETTTSESK